MAAMVRGQTDGDITLWGVGGEQIPLSRPGVRRDGLALKVVPEGLSNFSRDHVWDEGTGSWRGRTLKPHQIRLDLKARGKYPRQYVDELLTALGVGDRPVRVSVASPELRTRWIEARVRDVSSLNWHGHPLTSHLVEFSVILEAGKPGWKGEQQTVTLTAGSEFGWVTLPVLGDMDVWPSFTITGGHGGVSVRLREDDEVQVIPYSEDGWLIDSRPDHRVVESLAGEVVFSGFVPFWPEPAETVQRRAQVEVLVTDPAPDFELQITYTPEASRGW